MTKQTKQRNTDYAQSTKLIKKFGLDSIEYLWKLYGLYRAADILNAYCNLAVTAWMIRTLVRKHGWQRDARLAPAILEGVINGKTSASSYPHLDFSGINLANAAKKSPYLNEELKIPAFERAKMEQVFFNWCTPNENHGFTDVAEVCNWKRYKKMPPNINTFKEFIRAMASKKNTFYLKDYAKLKKGYDQFIIDLQRGRIPAMYWYSSPKQSNQEIIFEIVADVREKAKKKVRKGMRYDPCPIVLEYVLLKCKFGAMKFNDTMTLQELFAEMYKRGTVKLFEKAFDEHIAGGGLSEAA